MAKVERPAIDWEEGDVGQDGEEVSHARDGGVTVECNEELVVEKLNSLGSGTDAHVANVLN